MTTPGYVRAGFLLPTDMYREMQQLILETDRSFSWLVQTLWARSETDRVQLLRKCPEHPRHRPGVPYSEVGCHVNDLLFGEMQRYCEMTCISVDQLVAGLWKYDKWQAKKGRAESLQPPS